MQTANETIDGIREISDNVANTVDGLVIALIAVAGISLIALTVAMIAVERSYDA
jgi:hypothetical protein